ncbi:glycosyltransferase [Oenococcus sicerae]|uniref:Glycosyltransferase n=1 Tax=Oenococcus sicerae TaxID=2203724 RepID=A0AAJ1R9J5_9LACO|nr:glycosyltransferase family 2 protein [Oenococcus sicerae]MDN6900689.1 glycosyltransferase [Oenococcus sicerae]QAS69307.1 glycosyltransferase [Oenococcus sicerae]
MLKMVAYEDAVNNRIFDDNVSKRMVLVIPAHNEADTITSVLQSIVAQRGVTHHILDVFIALDNCTDNTENEIRKFSNQLNLYVLETVNNKERKSGALNQIYRLFLGDLTKEPLSEEHLKSVKNIDAFVGIDADVYLARDCLSTLYLELIAQYKTGAVSANYQCLLPESINVIPRNDPNREYMLKHGKFGGPMSRFYAVAQNVEFSTWTIKQKVNNHIAQIAGGQCSMFRPETLKDVYTHFKMNGVYSNESDTEDLLLTQQIREVGWQCKISDSARCYVDSMNTLPSLYNQRKKWQAGIIQYMTKAGISTAYARQLWSQEILMAFNFLIRIMLVVLIPVALIIHEFVWSYIWFLPILVSAILNTVATIKTPNRRLIDVLLALTTIPAELTIWFKVSVHLSTWRDSFRIEKIDGWALQYQAENGTLKHNYSWFYITIALIAALFVGFYFKWLSVRLVVDTIKPYLNASFNILTYLTFITFIFMLFQLSKLRGHYKA